MFRSIIVAAIMGVATACATASSAGRSSSYRGSQSTSEFVALDELRRVDHTGSLLDALARVRPRMLLPRVSYHGFRQKRQAVDVFINGQYSGDLDVLRSLNTHNVASVRMVRRSQGYVVHGSWLRGEHALLVTLVR